MVIGKDIRQNELYRLLRQQGTGKIAFAAYNEENIAGYIDRADVIYITGLLSKKTKDSILSYCVARKKRVYLVPETYEIALRKSEMTQVGDVPVFAVEGFGLSEAQRMIKRAIDIVLSVLAILVTSPFMFYAAIRIRHEDGGPVFYRQIRSGISGKEFTLLKFRSMVIDAEKETGAVFASENDARITRFGAKMRACRLDEIPQFFNVLKGDMSIIGPRPERPVFVQKFSEQNPEYQNRFAVKPGITGLAQVMGNYTTTPENKLKFDLVYIREYALLLDLKILFKTVGVVFSGRQARGFSEEDAEPFDINSEVIPGTSGHLLHSIGKTALLFLCFLVIVTGAMFLRFSALSVTMMEAAATPQTEGQIAGPTAAQTASDGTAGASTTDSENKGTGINSNSVEATNPVNGTSASADKGIMTEKGESTLAAASESVVLSQKEINTAMNDMTMSEKMGIALDLVSRMDANDLMLLEKMSEDGFTATEKAKAKEMMYQYFDDKEISYIKKVYQKYVE